MKLAAILSVILVTILVGGLTACTDSANLFQSTATDSLNFGTMATIAIENTTPSPSGTPPSELETILPGWIGVVNRSGIKGSGIDLVSANGQISRRVVNTEPWNSSMAWSPDGQWISFEQAWKEFESVEIYLIRPDGSESSRITYTTANEFDLSWSPDGQYLAYTKRLEIESAEIYIMDLVDRSSQRLTYSTVGAINPAFSPDGKLIAYQQLVEGTRWCAAQVMIMDSDGGDQKIVTDMLTTCESRLSWSPDGQWITFTAYEPETRCSQLYIIRPDGRGLSPLTDLPGCAQSPTWSSDGRHVAFIYTEKPDTDWWENRQIYLMNADGSGLTLLEPGIRKRYWDPIDIKWAPVPALAVGYSYMVTSIGAPLVLQETPDMDSEAVTTLAEGEEIDVLEGPVEVGGYWWKVRSEDGTEGWVLEVLGWYTWKQ